MESKTNIFGQLNNVGYTSRGSTDIESIFYHIWAVY